MPGVLAAFAALVILVGLFSLPARPLKAEVLGSYFLQTQTHAYSRGPGKGSRKRLRVFKSYGVTDFVRDSRDRLWYVILVPEVSVREKNQGWMAIQDGLPFQKQKFAEVSHVFAQVPESWEQLHSPKSFKAVPTRSISPLASPPKVSLSLHWQKVNYRYQRPAYYWILADKGIYRPDRDTQFINQRYMRMVEKGMNRTVIFRLLAGLVHKGDNPEKVELALGEPQARRTLQAETATVWDYPFVHVKFLDGLVVSLSRP